MVDIDQYLDDDAEFEHKVRVRNFRKARTERNKLKEERRKSNGMSGTR